MKYFYPESEEEEEDDDQRLKLKEITQIVSVRDVDVETLGPVQQRNPIETDDLEYAVRGTYKRQGRHHGLRDEDELLHAQEHARRPRSGRGHRGAAKVQAGPSCQATAAHRHVGAGAVCPGGGGIVDLREA